MSVSIIGTQDDKPDDALSATVQQEMSQWFGGKQTDDWELLRVYRVPFAQPNQVQTVSDALPSVGTVYAS